MHHPAHGISRKTTSALIGYSVGCLALIVGGRTSIAQTASNAAEASSLEEITVTARRRAENLQNVPDTITAFSSQTIEDARIQKFSDFAAMTPNFEFFPSATPGNFQMSIRGISQAGGNGGDAPVVMVVDGVTLP
jgi:iron complex outermembrane recepter protein